MNMLLPETFRALDAARRYKLVVVVAVFAQLTTSTRRSSTASRCEVVNRSETVYWTAGGCAFAYQLPGDEA